MPENTNTCIHPEIRERVAMYELLEEREEKEL
jgi:hypothetical protein